MINDFNFRATVDAALLREPGLLTQGVPQDPLVPRRGPLGSSLDRESAKGQVGNAPALVPEPLARM